MSKKNVSDSAKLFAAFSSFPTVLVTSQENIITVTLVHIFSFSPPLLGIGIKPERHSFGLIDMSKEFVVNIPTKDILQATIFCGAKSGRDVDKFKETNLTKEPSLSVKTVSIKECPVNIECKLVQKCVTGDRTWFVGEVVNGRMAENFKKEDTIQYWQGVYRLPGNIIK